LRQVVLFIHIAAAMFWIGEMLLLALVVGPYSRALGQEERSRLFSGIGRRSLPFAWGAIIVLVITGLLNLAYLHISLGELIQPSFYRTPFGTDLDLKLLVVIAMITLSAVHDFVVARRNGELRRRLAEAKGRPPADLVALQTKMRTLASRLGQLNLILALAVLFFAAGLVTGGL